MLVPTRVGLQPHDLTRRWETKLTQIHSNTPLPQKCRAAGANDNICEYFGTGIKVSHGGS